MRDECKVTASESLDRNGANKDATRKRERAMGPSHYLHGSLLMILVENALNALCQCNNKNETNAFLIQGLIQGEERKDMSMVRFFFFRFSFLLFPCLKESMMERGA